MKRDFDLIKNILLAIENDENATGRGFASLNIDDGYSQEQVSYHVKLLYEAGLIEAIDLSGGSYFRWEPQSLTWDGHEFLDSARNEDLWEKAKEKSKSAGIFSFQILRDMLVELAKEQLSF